ncbi:putative hydrolase [Cyphellophora attinorum]|uniref:Putative hydrolase n=1 Tax=Cyphellophora attinorum TaxID=1664694 RepID=A0A0N1H077_9EURO|nr:putative hydrolase [Phialophora attinorum]KPI37164.1 putative hydrolase [Phialophora attinorum]
MADFAQMDGLSSWTIKQLYKWLQSGIRFFDESSLCRHKMDRLFELLSALLIGTSALPSSPPESCLDWTPCNISFGYQGWLTPPPYPYQCANLTVPLDYTDPNSEDLTLDLLRVEALHKPAKKSILLNPGGPGASGIQFVALTSDAIHEVLGGDYDLIGFDPRGTGRTLPFACNETFSQDPGGANLTLPTNVDVPKDKLVMFNVEQVVDEAFPFNERFADKCEQQMKDAGSYLGTAFVARDTMLEIAKAIDGKDALLNYIGIGHGTYIGQTFAAMFPERVGSFLLDSNVNPRDWRSGFQYSTSQDADKALLNMLHECINNPDKCALARYAPSGDPLKLLAFINSQRYKIEELPDYQSLFYSWESFKQLLHSILYSPIQWSWATDIIQEELFPIKNSSDRWPPFKLPDGEPGPEWNLGINALHGIMCSDSLWKTSQKEELLHVAQKQWQTSAFADILSHRFAWPCAVWKMKSKEIYDGDFEVKTASPVMFVNGKFDPITPWSSAVNVSAGFEGSVLLEHGGVGHGMYAHPSLCTAKAVRAYLDEGVLPQPGTRCEPDVDPFDVELPEFGLPEPGKKKVKRRSLGGDITEGDLKLLKAMRKLNVHLNQIELGEMASWPQ